MARDRVDTVYFVRRSNDGAVKIGFTTREKRLRWELAREARQAVTLLLAVPASRGDEQHLHCHFAPLRLDGEWFKAEKSLLGFIDGLRSGDERCVGVLKAHRVAPRRCDSCPFLSTAVH